MSRKVKIIISLILASLLSILEDLIASYVATKFGVDTPSRVVLVVITFILSFGSLLFITLKMSDHGDETYIRQHVHDVEGSGKLIGAQLDDIDLSSPLVIEQETNNLAGVMIGLQVKKQQGDGVHMEDTENRAPS
jgi:hypothetical protein